MDRSTQISRRLRRMDSVERAMAMENNENSEFGFRQVKGIEMQARHILLAVKRLEGDLDMNDVQKVINSGAKAVSGLLFLLSEIEENYGFISGSPGPQKRLTLGTLKDLYASAKV